MFREGVIALLTSDQNFEVCAQGASGDDAIELAETYRPDAITIDVEMPGIPTERAIRHIRRSTPTCAVIVITMHDDDILRNQLARAGAISYLPKIAGGAELTRTIRNSVRTLRENPTKFRPVPEGGTSSILTRREREVLRMIATARSNRDIGAQLTISEATVKRHTSNLYAKLKATSRLDAIRIARRLGIL